MAVIITNMINAQHKRCVLVILILMFSSSLRANDLIWAISDDTKSDFGIITSLIALIGTIVTYWSFKRKQFSDLVTAERLRFVKEWREYSARFCELLTDSKENVSGSKKECSIEYYYYKLIFMCNPTKPESYLDQEVVGLLEQLYALYEEIRKNECKEKDKLEQELKLKRNQFVALIQANIAVEWQGITAESRKGKLSDEQKEDLRQEHYKNYLKKVESLL